MSTTKKKDFQLVQQFESLKDFHPVLSGLENLQNNALTILVENGFPTIKEEEYKYTGITKRISESISDFRKSAQISGLSQKKITTDLPSWPKDANIIVTNNGYFEGELSSFDENDLSIQPFSKLDPHTLATFIGSIEKPEKDAFTALNTALLENGVMVQIPAGKRVKKPIYLIHYVQPGNDGHCIFPRVFVNANKNAEATIVEMDVFLDEKPVFINSVAEFGIHQNAHVKHYKLQDGHKSAITVSNTSTNVHRDATFTSVVLSLEADMIRNNLSLNLVDGSCEGNMYGLFLLNGRTHVDNHTNVDHTQAHALSNELYKGILNDQSRGVFNGKIFVRKDAQKTNAFQQNSNLLLSENATINTKPQLEIWADDVKCSHGCTTGQLDDEALFYIRSRGIGKEAARALLLYAFAGEVLEQIQEEAFKKYCKKTVNERLGGNY
ncbi:MAG: Fe-S cluster assembly protein SufD [Cyclobacteriaceae bacterium]